MMTIDNNKNNHNININNKSYRKNTHAKKKIIITIITLFEVCFDESKKRINWNQR